ncbi:MAG: magnesium and cobalt transport protein CorA [Phycisphaerales bacterium]|nr:magnesium and cobalt transport protein CorA [Phycisphaerales bacterium]
MLTAFILDDGQVSRDTSPAALSRALRDPDAVFWLDMSKPTDEELALLDDVFGFHPLAIEDTIGYSQRPKIENYDHTGEGCKAGYFYMVFHGPDLQSFREKVRTKELDLFVSGRYLVTIHDEQMKSVSEILTRAEADPKRLLERGTDVILYNILDHMVDHYEPILDYLQEALDDLEERALVRPRPEVLTEISFKKRELLNLRRIVAPQREVVAQLTRGDVPFVREGTRVFMRDVQDHLVRVVEMVELYRDLVVGARDIYLSSISNRLNEIMKTLTMMTVIAIPLTVITGFFGMNFDVPGFKHLLESPVGFWGSLLGTGGIIVGIVMWFYRKGWLVRADHAPELTADEVSRTRELLKANPVDAGTRTGA